MLSYYETLSEKGRRHYAAQEAEKLGHGGKRYIGRLLGMSQKTLRKGIKELSNPSLLSEIPTGKQRRSGGGRKKRVL
jgi:hypothetical protein